MLRFRGVSQVIGLRSWRRTDDLFHMTRSLGSYGEHHDEHQLPVAGLPGELVGQLIALRAPLCEVRQEL